MSSKICKTIDVEKVKMDACQIPGTILQNQPEFTVVSTADAGPAITASADASDGPTVTLTTGTGGVQAAASGTANGGAGGDILLTSGDGGSATGAGSTGDSGDGGAIRFTPGAGGTSVGGTAGVDGVVKFVQNPPFVWNTLGTSISVAASFTMSVAQMRAGIIELADGGIGAGFNVTTPTATDIVAAFPEATANDTFELVIYNISTQTATIQAGVGVTRYGTAALTDGICGRYLFSLTDVSTPAVTVWCNISS